MTPFDPAALLVMLLAFYPVVSVANLRTARAERPEYFAGGTLGGSKGEKLFLQDGRVYDLIFAAGGPPSGQRWQALDVPGDAGAGDPSFALDPGPLAPLDEEGTLPPAALGSFESLVAAELGALDGTDRVLDGAATTVLEFDGAAALDGSSAALLGPAAEHHAAMRRALDLDDPAEELEAAGLTRGTIDGAITEYAEAPPDPMPEDDPGPRPRDPDDPRPPKIPGDNE